MHTQGTWLLLWLLALLVRVVSALFNRTFFSPDEYWQCGEVAHKVVFGYGVFTWEWLHALRPVLPVAPLIALYQLLAWLHADYAWIVAVAPSLMQALFASVGDVAMYHAAMRLAGPSAARCTLALHLTSHFLFYCIARPFSNSLETVLTQLALSLWPWSVTGLHQHASTRSSTSTGRATLALLFAALSVAVRPTAVLTWFPLSIALVLTSPTPIALILRLMLPIGVLVQLCSAVLDRCMYGQWVCVACNFVHFNATPGMAARYGTQPWHWYVTSAWPTLLGISLPLTLLGAHLAPTRLLSVTICFVTAALSLNLHKEFRFLLPVLPLALLLAGIALARLFHTHHYLRPILIFAMVTSVAAGIYLASVHQRGPITLMSHLSTDLQATSVLLLMPCHSTPLYSHLHRNISVKYLDCSPALWPTNSSTAPYIYTDEADVFYQAPLTYLNDNFAPCATHLPTHVAFFSVLLPTIQVWLKDSGYSLEAEFFHTQLVTDDRQSHTILLYKFASLLS